MQAIFNRVVAVLDFLRRGPLRKVDPKLFNSLVVLTLTRVALHYGVDLEDPLWTYALPIISGAAVGWFTENAGTPEVEGDTDEPDADVPDGHLLASEPDADVEPDDLTLLLPPEER